MPLTVRVARSTDYAAFVRLFPELGVDDPLPTEARFVAEIGPRSLIAEEAGAACGYTFFQLLDKVAYVRHLVTAPEARRRGVGRALLLAVAARARDAGATSWTLNVRPDNVPALALYEGLGMKRTYRLHALRIAWADALEARLRMSDEIRTRGVACSLLAPSDDAAVERAVGLLPGHLREARKLPGRILVVAREGDAVVGAAAFDPTFPGAFPFRAASAAVAFALLDLMRQHKRPEDDIVNLAVEGQPEIADAVLAAGGVLRLEAQNLAGALPTP